MGKLGSPVSSERGVVNSIDHILPVSAFAKHGICDLRIINDLSNLRPMYRLENIAKGDRYNEDDFWRYVDGFNASGVDRQMSLFES